MIKKETIEQKWHKQSETAKDEAAKLPHGQLKDHLLQEARQLQTRFPDQSVAIIARSTAAHVTNNPRGRLSWRPLHFECCLLVRFGRAAPAAEGR
jgi:hypothetical protein